jgi:hypothetical protein
MLCAHGAHAHRRPSAHPEPALSLAATERPGARAKDKSREAKAQRCRRKFLRVFPRGFHDPTYIDWERAYKWQAHLRWRALLAPPKFAALLARGEFELVARHATAIESRTNLLFSFEKMALRDALRDRQGARVFAEGLHDLLHGSASIERRFDAWVAAVASLPRRQTRVLTWPVVTIFPFLAQPRVHFYLKPTVTRVAADAYGHGLEYRSAPNWATYASALAFAATVRRDLRDLRPRDQIDAQSFIWVQGSEEYA